MHSGFSRDDGSCFNSTSVARNSWQGRQSFSVPEDGQMETPLPEHERRMYHGSGDGAIAANEWEPTNDRYPLEVTFACTAKDTADRKRRKATYRRRQIIRCFWQWLVLAQNFWQLWGRPVAILASVYELWSIGIWLAFLTEQSMSGSVYYVVLVDIVGTIVSVSDMTAGLSSAFLEEHRSYLRVQKEAQKVQRRKLKAAQGSRNSSSGGPSGGLRRSTASVDMALEQEEVVVKHEVQPEKTRAEFLASYIRSEKGWYKIKTVAGIILASAMIPVQLLLLSFLQEGKYAIWKVVLILAFRMGRVVWAFRDFAHMVTQQELKVYVDIQMHGTNGSPWNQARILAKQFLIVFSFAHVFGCLAYACRQLDLGIRQGLTRDYFEHFEDVALVDYRTGEDFIQTYLLALYKGLHLNYEDLLPERPFDLLLEVAGSILVLLMKSYCIGSFFKFHQKREFEVQRFAQLMASVQQYLDLYEVPPSLRKAVLNHFRFQQANQRKQKTIEVIGRLPLEIQAKLRHCDVLPIVVDRNPSLFGAGLSRDYCMQIAMSLTWQFLQPGEVIFLQAEVPRELVFLDSGSVSFSRRQKADARSGQRATEQMMRYVRSDKKEDPTALGAVALILGCRHLFSARVRPGIEAITLHMPRADFDELNAGFPDEYDKLFRNAAEAHLLDVRGGDLASEDHRDARVGDHEAGGESFQSLRQDVQHVLKARQDQMVASFTYSATVGDAKAVKELLHKRMDVNVCDYDGRSAMHLAASEGNAEVISALLEAAGNANLKDRWGSTPMKDALKHHYMGVAKSLREHKGKLELADPAGELCTCASEGDTTMMQQLLDFGVDPNSGDYDGRTALHLSASEGHLPVLTFLTSRSADINVKDRWNSTPIEDAIRNGFFIAAAHLRLHGAKPDPNFAAKQACEAATRGDLRMLQCLFELGVDFDLADYDGRTPLHFVATEGSVGALDYLVNAARAQHSLVDRRGSTPLQDAIANGHELCARILVVSGAVLGPSARAEEEEKVRSMSADLGFGSRNGVDNFLKISMRLRRHISAHMAMVQKGRARSDIFDPEQAVLFNKSVISATFVHMRGFGRDISWFASLVQSFESAAEPLWQLVRLINDASALEHEAKFWKDVSHLEQLFLSSGNKNKLKDARDMIFHQSLLGGMRFAPSLVQLMNACSRRVIARVEDMHQDQIEVADQPSHLSRILAQEVMRELKMDFEEEDRFRQSGAASSQGMTWRRLAIKIETLAEALLFGEQMCLTLSRGALALRGSGAQAVPGQSEGDCTLARQGTGALLGDMVPLTDTRATAPLARTLEHRARSFLAGAAIRRELADEFPGALDDLRSKDMYGSLWPISEEQRQGSKEIPSITTDESESGAGAYPSSRLKMLVASELLLLAIVALVLEGWDADVLNRGSMSELKVAPKNAKQRRSKKSANKGAEGGSALPLSAWQDLGRMCRETAFACRGAPTSDHQERTTLLRKFKLRFREQRRHKQLEREAKKRVAAAAGGDPASPIKANATLGAVAAPGADAVAAAATPGGVSALGTAAPSKSTALAEVDDDDAKAEDPEQMPILAAKILSMSQLSFEELTSLVDIDDRLRAPMEEGRRHRLFGEISRERFVLNWVRSLLNHDETQKEIVEDETLLEAARVAKLDKEVILDSCQGELPPPLKDEDRMWKEVTMLQEAFSEGGELEMALGEEDENEVSEGESEDEEGPSMSYAVVCDVAPAQAATGWFGFRRGPGVDGVTCFQFFLSKLTWFCRVLGAEGRMRRKQRRIAKRFRELDDDGDGLGPGEVARIIGLAFSHTLGQEAELRNAYRIFELLNKADVGDLVTLPELLSALPRLEEEVKEQQRKNLRASHGNEDASWAITRFASRLIVPPDSRFLWNWDIVKRLIVIYYMLEVPIRFSFLNLAEMEEQTQIAFNTLNWSADAFMALNVVLTFFRGFNNESRGTVTSFPEIRQRYVFGFFAWDIAACCPIDGWMPEKHGTTSILARPRAALRLLRLLHLRHLFGPGGGADVASRGFAYVALVMSLGILSIAHFLACIWWLLGTRFDDFDPSLAFNTTVQFNSRVHTARQSWTFAYVHRPFETPIGDWTGVTPFWWQYLVSFYWSVGRVTSQSSPGNLFAASWPELVWVCILFLINFAVQGYCDGILVDKVIQGDEQAIEAQAMRRIVDEYLHTADLPQELMKDIRHAAERSEKVVERQRMEATVAAMPRALRQRVASRVIVPKLNAEIFRGCSEHFMVELGSSCRVEAVAKDQVISAQGEPADKFIVLLGGRVGVMRTADRESAQLAAQSTAGGVDEGAAPPTRQLAETSTAGEMIGEMPFIFDLKNMVSIVALEESKLLVLYKKDFRACGKLYPEDMMAMMREAMRLIFEVSNDDGGDAGDDGKSQARSAAKSAAKSAARSAAKSAKSMNSMSSLGSQSTSVSHAVRRMYAGDISIVMDRLRAEQAKDKNEVICGFIQKAADGDIEGVRRALQCGEARVDEGDYDSRTALHLAVCNGHLDLVRCLVSEFGASIIAKDRFNNSPVDDAVRERHPTIAKYLVSRGAKCQADAGMAATLCQAACDNDIQTIKLLLQDVQADPNVADYDSRTALHLAACSGHMQVVRLLVQLPGIALSPKDRLGNTPLDDAMRHDHVQVRRFLRGKGAKMGNQKLGVIFCEMGFQANLDALKTYVDAKVKVNKPDHDFRTALHLAACENHLAVATYLVQAKTDPNVLDRFLHTPLDDAMSHGHFAMQEYLRSVGGERGSADSMRHRVAAFQTLKVEKDDQRKAEKIDREVNNTEVCKVRDKLAGFRKHPSLEDDIHTFAGHATNYRDLLLRLFHRAALPEEVEDRGDRGGDEDESGAMVDNTKEHRMAALTITASELDLVSSRLQATLEVEVLPWLRGLSKGEERLLNIYVPGLKASVCNLLDHLKVQPRFAQFSKHFWREDSRQYQCSPVAFLMQRMSEAPMEIMQRSRLEAAALCWTTGLCARRAIVEQATVVGAQSVSGESGSNDDATETSSAPTSDLVVKSSQKEPVRLASAVIAERGGRPGGASGTRETRYGDRVRESLVLKALLEEGEFLLCAGAADVPG